MARKRQNFDNGMQGDIVTATNSATSGGDAFSSVTVAGNGKGVYDVGSACFGAKGVRVTGGSGDTFSMTLSDTSDLAGTASVMFKINAYPTANAPFLYLNSTAGVAGMFTLTPTGSLNIQNSVGTTLHTFTFTLSLNTFYSVIIRSFPGNTSTNGSIGGDIGTLQNPLIDSFSSGSVNAGTTQNITSVTIGKLTTGSDGFDLSFDTLSYSSYPSSQRLYVTPMTYYNSAEGGTDGVAATTANTGSATDNALSAVNLGGGTVTFSSEQAHSGSLSYKLVPAAAGGAQTSITWGFVNILDLRQAFFRVYVYMTAYPSTATQLMAVSGSANIAIIAISPTGTVITQGNAGTVNTSTATFPLNTWVRCELYAALGTTTTNGSISSAIYNDDSATPITSYSSSAVNSGIIGTTLLSGFAVGKRSNSGTWATMYADDLNFIADSDATTTLNIQPYSSGEGYFFTT